MTREEILARLEALEAETPTGPMTPEVARAVYLGLREHIALVPHLLVLFASDGKWEEMEFLAAQAEPMREALEHLRKAAGIDA